MNLKVLANKKALPGARSSWLGLNSASFANFANFANFVYISLCGLIPHILSAFLCLSLGFIQLSCSQVNSDFDSETLANTNRSPAIQAVTILPKHFSYRYFSNAENILVPRKMLNLASISRPKAEVRDGPGVEFILLDKILENGEMVIVFDSKGVWKKVHAYKSNITGWVHEKTIKKLRGPGENLALNLKLMPTVIAIKALNFIHSFPDKKRIKVRIRKGSQFIALKKATRSTLVWIAETNSVAWLSQKFVQ